MGYLGNQPLSGTLTGDNIVDGTVNVEDLSSSLVSTINGKADSSAIASAVGTVNLSYTGTLTGGTGVVNIGSGQLYKDASGNVGVGVTTSAWDNNFRALQVGHAAAVISGNNQYGAFGAFYANAVLTGLSTTVYKNAGFATTYTQNDGAHIWQNAPSGTAGNPITFTEKMRLDSSGNLGLGTVPSAATLPTLFFGGVGSATAGNNSSLFLGNAWIDGADTRYRTTKFATQYEQDNLNGTHRWYTAPSGTAGTVATFTERLRLDSSGNLGLGVVPSGWRSVDKALQVRSTVVESVNNTTAVFGLNYYRDTSGTERYINSDFASRIIFNNAANGSIAFSTAPSGTAGNAISFTQAMTLDASGNLALGTSDTGNAFVTLQKQDASLRLNPLTGAATIQAVETAVAFRDLIIGANNTIFQQGGTERARIDSSGNLGVGTSTPSPYKLNVNGQLRALCGFSTYTSDGLYGTGAAPCVINTPGAGQLLFGYIDAGGGQYAPRMGFAQQSPNVPVQNSIGNSVDGTFNIVVAGAERARINTAGDLCIGKVVASETVTTGTGYGFASPSNDPFFSIVNATAGSANACIYLNRRNTQATNGLMVFISNDGTSQNNVGSISHNGSSTNYATSSDYRLKEDIAPMTGALARVAQLKPCTYKWKVDGSDGEGFIAHELQEVVPQCVTGQKDAVDAEGKPQYQGVDTSFLVATLTAAIQELKAEFDAYKAAHP
jgi:hypothetical protein